MRWLAVSTPWTRYLTALLLTATLVASTRAEDLPKARLGPTQKDTQSLGTAERIRLAPVLLEGGSELSIIAPKGWMEAAQQVSTTLISSHAELAALFGEIPQFRTGVQLMDEDTFFLATGAPRWTNALYFKDQIILPLPQDHALDLQNISRSVKHEYTHAVIHALTGGNCPGWLDEGIAQWREGSIHPAIKRALASWLERNNPLPLSLLQGGFTRLDQKVVPAAYAQSLWMTQYLATQYGFLKLRRYFDALKASTPKEQAFAAAFGVTQTRFETAAAEALRTTRSF